MLALNKPRNNTQLVGFLDKAGPHSSKPRKRYLQQLEGEVNRSRIAIDNMSHTCAIESSLVKKVEELQKELHRCILNINQESQRQRTLQQLTAVLRGQMSEVQAVQRNQQEYQSNTFEKKSKKVEYDIKQILHKYNEEVAKINSLKEQANAARDERVVYSNLFNKIEKEIKHYEQVYKQTVIKNQIFIDRKTANTGNSENYQPSVELPTAKGADVAHFIKNGTSRQGIATINQLTKVKDSQGRQQKRSIKMDVDTFLTTIRDTKSVKDDSIRPSQAMMTTTRTNDSNISKNINALIREKEGDIDRIIVTAECKNFCQVVMFYQTVEQQNDMLMMDVELVDERMALVEEEIERIRLQKRCSHIEEKIPIGRQKEKIANSAIEEVPNGKDEISTEQVVVQIISVLGLTATQKQLYSDEIMREIDLKVDGLGCWQYQRKQRKDSHMFNGDETFCGSDRGVCELLQKIERFNESERLLDRASLKLEYTRELSKVRKKGKKML